MAEFKGRVWIAKTKLHVDAEEVVVSENKPFRQRQHWKVGTIKVLEVAMKAAQIGCNRGN